MRKRNQKSPRKKVHPDTPDGESGEPEEPEVDPEESEEPEAYGMTYPIHTGGGWYELSNGERVQSKEAAEQAQSELEGD